jgi:hypothetical protein
MDMSAGEKDELPWFYRFLLKIPFVRAATVFGEYEGVYWAIVLPLLMVMEFVVSFFLLLCLPFPVNIIATGIIPAFTLVIFIRVQLERFLNLVSTMTQTVRKWDVAEAIDDYVRLLEVQKRERKRKAPRFR